MKKFLSILLVFMLVFASLLVFASCGSSNGDGTGDEGGNDDTLIIGGMAEEDVPAGFNKYTKGVDVDVYTPAGWNVYSTAFTGIQMIDTATGNQIDIKATNYDAASGYQAVTLEVFESTVVAPLRTSGCEIKEVKSLGDSIYYCEYVNAMGVTIKLTNAYIDNAGENQAITVSATFLSDLGTTDVIKVVLGTIKVK